MQNYNIDEEFKDIISPEKYAGLMENVRIISYRNTIKFHEKFPEASADNGTYRYTSDFYDSWHGGWWAGIYYLAYMAFGDTRYRCYAENLSSKLYALIKNNRIIHREMGFIYLPVCIPDIMLNKNAEALEACILAAEYMAEAFNLREDYEFMKYSKYYYNRYQAAAMVNSRILNAASKISNNPEFLAIAGNFVNNCVKYNITADGNCHMNAIGIGENGEPQYTRDDSAQYGFPDFGDYVRPYAWIAMGLGLEYISGNDEKYEEILYKILNRFLEISGGNLGCFVPGDENGRKITDSTSMAIFVRIFAELKKYMDKKHPHYDFYSGLFEKWFNVMITFAIDADSGKQGLLDSGILLIGYVQDDRRLRNSSNICGDYFYFETLMSMLKGYKSCWNTDNIFD